ncbi:Retrotransposable element Tf2 protein [Rhizoctonia solani]|uniref:Retrotransposable element Tf2 protein n=1 Tax=Rhizoctonia solani TaxID=456999 RepID=A0A8H8SZ31_9AGAM|nr:Retrotransposable element Tf2 protein [Rhizoctonia solani]QRW23144.1 Retrotransposable element Tf2 protein [Rhizoctonia solani]
MHNKELLAIIQSFEHWRIFLEEQHILSQFLPITGIWNTGKSPEPSIAATHNGTSCWPAIISRSCIGQETIWKANALSRWSDHANIPPANQTMLPDPVFANVALLTPEKELQCQIKASLDQDESLEEILQFLQGESKALPSVKQAFKDYKMEAGLLFYQGRIVVLDVGTLQTDVLRIFHNSPLAGHPGRQRTLELVSRNYYWPRICADTYWHVDSCETCQQIRKPKYASIPPQPLELPSQPWQHVSYNMIVDLPKDGNNNSILVIVDSFTKYGIFVKCSKKLKAPELAELFLENVWKHHDSYRPCTNALALTLTSLAYHPQSNRQTEQVNPSIKHFVRAYSGVNQRDWTKWLPMAEFAYNNAVHSSTGKTPFKALYGWEPTLTPSNVPTDVPEAEDLAQTMEAQWKEVESTLWQSKQQMVAGEEGSPTEFKIGEEVWLDAKNIKLKTLSPKLMEQCLGPFRVIKKVSNQAYCLELPPTMQIHNVFYIGLLSKVKRDKKHNFENRPPPVTIDREEEYKVEGITDAEEQNRKWFFRVKWKGYGSEENTWEPQENLKNAGKILKKYKEEMKKKALGAAKALRGGGSVVDTFDTTEFIPIFSNLNKVEQTTFLIT